MGYHEGGVELVLPILVKVIFLYNSSLFIGYGLSSILPLEGECPHDLTEEQLLGNLSHPSYTIIQSRVPSVKTILRSIAESFLHP